MPDANLSETDAEDGVPAAPAPEFTLTFKAPRRSVAGVEYDSAMLREPTVEEVAAAQQSKGVYAQFAKLMSLTSGLHITVFTGMAISDYNKGRDYLIQFVSPDASGDGGKKLDEPTADSFVLDLSELLMVGGTEYTSIKLTEPTVRTVEAAMKLDGWVAQYAEMMARSSSVDRAVFDKMKISDFVKAQVFMLGFINANTPSA